MNKTIIILTICTLTFLFYFGYFYKSEPFIAPETNDQTINSLVAFSNALASQIPSQSGDAEQSPITQDLVNQVTSLNNRIQSLVNLNRDAVSVSQITQSPSIISSTNPMNDTVSTLLSQDNKIHQLQSRLKQLQQLYASYLQKKTNQTEKYDKIPVYSSCIVSEADGQYTITMPPTQ